MVTVFEKMLHLKAGKLTVTVKNWWQNALITAEEFCNQKCQNHENHDNLISFVREINTHLLRIYVSIVRICLSKIPTLPSAPWGQVPKVPPSQ